MGGGGNHTYQFGTQTEWCMFPFGAVGCVLRCSPYALLRDLPISARFCVCRGGGRGGRGTIIRMLAHNQSIACFH
jgi:hypothetical protein